MRPSGAVRLDAAAARLIFRTMEKLAERNRAKVIDLLTERLTFERTGVMLYDAVIAKVTASNDKNLMRMLEELREIHAEEAEHAKWLAEQIKALGGDVDAKTEMAKLVEIEAKGIEQIVLDGDPDVGHLLHAILAAELQDNAGWDLLVQIADDAGDREAKRAFKKRLHEEEEHLLFMRRAVERYTRRLVLGEEVPMPPIIG